MTLPEFKLMDYEKQVDLLHKEGVYVGKRKIFSQTVMLFQLHTFYVEVYYRVHRKVIDHLNSTASTQILDPYLEQINVEEVVNIFE
jgi:hypothetical protein